MKEQRSSIPFLRTTAADWLRYAMEGVVLLLVVLSPWAFGAVDPVFEYALFAGVALLCLLWSARLILDGKLSWYMCPVVLAIAGIFAVGALQLIPLPSALLYVVSPATAKLRGDLLPEQPEIITADTAATSSWFGTISLYPYATQTELFRILAVLLLFACVRSQIASTGSLRRLCWACLINGVLLSVLALSQFFSAKSNRWVYWIYETGGQVFGPFICRNHFAFYLNMCIGLTIGLFLISGRSESDVKTRRVYKSNALVEQDEEDTPTFSLLAMLHSPLQLWLAVSMALMVAAVFCSLSRGGVAALALAIVLCVVVRFLYEREIGRLDLIVVPVILIAGVLAWVGIGPIEARFSGLLKGNASTDGRMAIWKNLLPLAPRYPIFGTGYGTLQYVEPLYRTHDYPGYNADVFVDHAHNDFLEAMIEGGVLRLILTVLVVALLFRFGFKALRRHAGRTPGKLAFGALIAVAAVAFHSLVDFGMYTPAVTVLATVVAAQLVAMSRNDPSEPPSLTSGRMLTLSLGGWGGIVGGSALAILALMLLLHGRQIDYVGRLRVSAGWVVNHAQLPDPTLAVRYLEAAAKIAPGNAGVRDELGQAYLDARNHVTQQQLRRDPHWANLRAATVFAIGMPANGAVLDPNIACALAVSEARAVRLSIGGRDLNEQYVYPALTQFVAARDLCPLLPRPHLRIAAFAKDMVRADSTDKYWQRALRLAPRDPDPFYYVGKDHLKSGNVEAAFAAWRQSLRNSSKFAPQIAVEAVKYASPEELMAKVFSNDPVALLKAAKQLAGNSAAAPVQRKLLERGRSILQQNAAVLSGSDLHMLATYYRLLDEPDEAIAKYRLALEIEPAQIPWLYDLAELYYQQKRYSEARKEAQVIVNLDPQYGPALTLLQLIKAREQPGSLK